MKIAKLFSNGSSQAVRLPKECRFRKGEREVYVHKIEDLVMLIPKRNPWAPLIRSLDKFSGDFMNDRHQPRKQDIREKLT